MAMTGLKHLLAAAFACVLTAGPAWSEPLRVRFDFSRSEIGVAATIKGSPVYVFVDSGTDPSTIDLARAKELHLKLGRSDGGQVTGTGSGKAPQAFPTMIEGLAIAGHSFPGIEAVAVDLGVISQPYGRRVDGVLGFSFLKNEAVLIDYNAHVLQILSDPKDEEAATRSCHLKWNADLRLVPGNNSPSFVRFRLGAGEAPVTLDTGSNSPLMLYQGALALPGLRAALKSQGTTHAGGYLGGETRNKYVMMAPIGFGPFVLPRGTSVELNAHAGPGGVVANAGNNLFAALKLKMLLDYPQHRMAFFGECS